MFDKLALFQIACLLVCFCSLFFSFLMYSLQLLIACESICCSPCLLFLVFDGFLFDRLLLCVAFLLWLCFFSN